MLQPVPDWRWGLNQRASQWYPSLRLVRQKNPGVWHDVVKEVAELLEHSYPDQQRQ
jgi:hypothetical protein